jgi:hypothetical protein
MWQARVKKHDNSEEQIPSKKTPLAIVSAGGRGISVKAPEAVHWHAIPWPKSDENTLMPAVRSRTIGALEELMLLHLLSRAL